MNTERPFGPSCLSSPTLWFISGVAFLFLATFQKSFLGPRCGVDSLNHAGICERDGLAMIESGSGESPKNSLVAWTRHREQVNETLSVPFSAISADSGLSAARG